MVAILYREPLLLIYRNLVISGGRRPLPGARGS